MSEKNGPDIIIATRVDKELYAKILARQREIEELTGYEPSVSAVVRSMIKASEMPRRQKRRSAKAASARA